MSLPARISALVVALMLIAGGCDSERRNPGPDLLDEVDVEPEITVEVDDTGFDPATLSVEEGEAFEVLNTGEGPHGFFIEDPYVETGLLLPGEGTVIVLTTPGLVEASDTENPGATLAIEVTPES